VKTFIFILGLAAVMLMPLAADQQSELLTIEQIALRAQAENPQVLKALRVLNNAEEDLAGESRLLESRLSLESANGTPQSQSASSGDPGDAAISGQAGITVPLLDQLSVGGSVTAQQGEEIGGELSLSITPFAAADPSYPEEETYGKALVAWQTLRQQTTFDAEQAALKYLIAGMEVRLGESTLDLEQKLYETVQKELELGEASFEELQDQLSELTTARKSLYSTESQALSSWKELQLLFDPDGEEVEPASLSFQQLEELIEAREKKISELTAEEPSSQSLENLKLELTALQEELEATPLWRPDFNLSGSVGLPDLSAYSIGASISFSPSDIKDDEREDLEEEIDEKLVDIQIEQFDLSLQEQLVEQNIGIAEQALEAASLAEEQASLTLRETELLYEQGERTVFELEQARLSLESAEIDSFAAAADLYQAQAELLMLYVVNLLE
jgi:outer membrane protein TolC